MLPNQRVPAASHFASLRRMASPGRSTAAMRESAPLTGLKAWIPSARATTTPPDRRPTTAPTSAGIGQRSSAPVAGTRRWRAGARRSIHQRHSAATSHQGDSPSVSPVSAATRRGGAVMRRPSLGWPCGRGDPGAPSRCARPSARRRRHASRRSIATMRWRWSSMTDWKRAGGLPTLFQSAATSSHWPSTSESAPGLPAAWLITWWKSRLTAGIAA